MRVVDFLANIHNGRKFVIKNNSKVFKGIIFDDMIEWFDAFDVNNCKKIDVDTIDTDHILTLEVEDIDTDIQAADDGVRNFICENENDVNVSLSTTFSIWFVITTGDVKDEVI